MARKFSYPEVQQLEVWQTVRVDDPAPLVRQKVKGYGSRKRRAFEVRSDRGACYAFVTRLPDPEPRAE